MKIKISCIGEGQILQYAKDELSYFIKQYSNHQVGDFERAEKVIVLDCLNKPDGDDVSYQLISKIENETQVLIIQSSKEKGVLDGVYDVLERMGLCFQMNGAVCNGMIDISACDTINYTSTPFCRYRGIRQHINFPMDISSYHIEDAKEYIRNLARMGINSITLHSYTGQWHGYETENNKVYAGNYFYGQRHVVPDYSSISKNVYNNKYYCIPEIEGQLQNEEIRQEFSIKWLNQVMETCKQVGLQITLSIELPNDEPMNELVNIVRAVLTNYPLIDTIEWISPEGGGQGTKFLLEEITAKIKEYFGEKALQKVTLNSIPKAMPESLAGAMESLKRAVDLYKRKDEILEGFEEKQIAIGLYVMCKETLKLLKNIMVSVLPKDVLLTFLPAHGSLAVAENIEYMEFTEEELQRTLIYSWIEFDGNMYLQQNSNKGIEAILEQTSAITKGKSIYGMCFNHWRTAENEIVAAYMAKATVKFETTSSFYERYAKANSIGGITSFTKAMELLEEIDCYNRDHLFNIGFCYLGCWLMYPGLGWIREWKKDDMLKAIELYREAIGHVECCLSQTESLQGISFLRFFINRMECSILQIRSILELNPICDMVDDNKPDALLLEQKEWIKEQCEKAMDLSKRYIDLHMEMLPDRGCQGTAVSYYATIPVYIDHIKQYFVYEEKECTHQPETFDAPPPPDTAYLQ